MSNSEQLQLSLIGAPADAVIVVLDNQNQEKWRGTTPAKINLPPGFYTVRTVRGTQFEESFVRLDQSMSLQAPVLRTMDEGSINPALFSVRRSNVPETIRFCL